MYVKALSEFVQFGIGYYNATLNIYLLTFYYRLPIQHNGQTQ